MDIKHGSLTKTVAHAADTIKRHKEFDLRLNQLFEAYAADIIHRYREILTCQDSKNGRNPVHFACMSKFTKCLKTLEAMLTIDIENVPGFKDFTQLYF
mgnify:CR=1 FL=1